MSNTKSRILVVDDESLVASTIATMFEEHDFDVVLAKNGSDALDILSTQKFDVVLSDLSMPGMDGIEMIKRIRSEEKTRYLPVVLITGKLEEDEVEKTKAAGVSIVFMKPFRFPDLLKAVKELQA